MWVQSSPVLLFEEADGTDEIPVRGPVVGNGVWCQGQGPVILASFYLHSLFIWELNGKLLFQYRSRR